MRLGDERVWPMGLASLAAVPGDLRSDEWYGRETVPQRSGGSMRR